MRKTKASNDKAICDVRDCTALVKRSISFKKVQKAPPVISESVGRKEFIFERRKKMPDSPALKKIRAQIAMDRVPKKSLARKCKVSRPQFSEMIHGDREMPQEVRTRLFELLKLKAVINDANI